MKRTGIKLHTQTSHALPNVVPRDGSSMQFDRMNERKKGHPKTGAGVVMEHGISQPISDAHANMLSLPSRSHIISILMNVIHMVKCRSSPRVV